MTEEEFLTALAKTPRGWHFVGKRIRGARGFCPIDEVAGVHYAWAAELGDSAGEPPVLRLGPLLASIIIEAADMALAAQFFYPESAAMRVKLLKACGLPND